MAGVSADVDAVVVAPLTASEVLPCSVGCEGESPGLKLKLLRAAAASCGAVDEASVSAASRLLPSAADAVTDAADVDVVEVSVRAARRLLLRAAVTAAAETEDVTLGVVVVVVSLLPPNVPPPNAEYDVDCGFAVSVDGLEKMPLSVNKTYPNLQMLCF